MIIDLRTRIWSNLEQFGPELAGTLRQRHARRWESLDASPAAHERAMECTTAACVLGFRSAMLDAAIPNELIAQFVAGDPRRRIGFAAIDPMAPAAMHEIDHAVHLGLAGITVSPALQGFHPSHSAAMRIYERCAELKLPIIVANDIPLGRSAILEFARPTAFDEVARLIPDLKIVIGDVGAPWTGETIALIAKHQNVYTDVSSIVSRPWGLYNVLLSAASYDVMDRVLFGSGFPFEAPTRAIESLYSVNSFTQGTHLPSVPRSLVRGIVERDALNVLGIEIDVGHAPVISVSAEVGERAAPREMAHAAVSEPPDDRDET